MKAIIFDLQGTLIDHSDPPKLFPETRDCLEKMRKKYLLSLVTEGKALTNVEGLLKMLEIRLYFKEILHLKGTSLQKRDGSAFLKMMELLNVEPSETVVVGDVPETDIRGGNAVGAMTIRIRQGKFSFLEPVNSCEKPRAEISNLGDFSRVLCLEI